MRTGWYRAVHVKSLDAHRARALLGARAQLVGMTTRLSNMIRGVLKTFGLLPGAGRGLRFDRKVEALLEGAPQIALIVRPLLATEIYAEVGDGVTGGRWRIVGVFAPPLLQQRSDTPCPMLPWSSCFNQGHSPTRSPRCYATERVPCWPKRLRPRWPNSSPSMSI